MKMNVIKFSYTNKRLYTNLIIGIVYISIGIINLFEENSEIKYWTYILIGIGLLMILLFTFNFSKKYFEISTEKIKLNTIPIKEINLKDLTAVKYYADDYIFQSPNKSLKIVKSNIKEKDLPKFKKFFYDLQTKLKEERK